MEQQYEAADDEQGGRYFSLGQRPERRLQLFATSTEYQAHCPRLSSNGFEAWDAKDILSYRTDDCVQYILPVSYSHGEARDNEGYRTWFEGVKPVFHNFTVGCGCSSPIEWVEC